MHFVEQMRTPLLNHFFIFMNLFDTIYFPIVIVPTVWIACSARWGVRVLCLLGLSALINGLLKQLFALPRPCVLDPHFCLIPIESYSFPSGGAQTAMLLGGLLFFSTKSKVWKAIALLYFLLVSFSRIYLGVHYPIDILAGWAVGGALLWLYFKGS